MADGALHFDEASHTYTVDGRVVPNVTSILEPITAGQFAKVDPQVLARAAALGKAVHRMIELDCADNLDTSSLSETLRLYYAAWQNFRQLSGFVILGSEMRVHSPADNYAGTLDLAGMLNGRYAIIDAKRTAQVPRSAGPQTAAYERAWRAHPDFKDMLADQPVDRYALHLTKDGRWKLVPFIEPVDLRVFLSCLTIRHWQAAKGTKP